MGCSECGKPLESRNKSGKCYAHSRVLAGQFPKPRGQSNHRWKGDAATNQAKQERAQKLYPLDGRQCERCPELARLRHHKDRDNTNNDPSNIEFLCRSCHTKEHKPHLCSPIISRT